MLEGIDCKGKNWYEIPLGRTQNLSGQIYDYLTVKFRVSGDFNKNNRVYWLCQCQCGNEVVAEGPGLRYGRIHSCGCYKKQLMSDTKSEKLEGQTFRKLTVIEAAGSTKTQKRLWKCKCECGNIAYATTNDLKNGHVNSCGCLHESIGELVIKEILTKYNIDFIYNKQFFKDLVLPNGGIGRYDFILLNENKIPYRIIEYDGIQHFSPTSFYYGHSKENNFNYVIQNDKIKNEYAVKHNLPLVRIPYTEVKNITIDTLLGNKFLINMEGVMESD